MQCPLTTRTIQEKNAFAYSLPVFVGIIQQLYEVRRRCR